MAVLLAKMSTRQLPPTFELAEEHGVQAGGPAIGHGRAIAWAGL